MIDVESLRRDFHLDDALIERRSEMGEYLHSFASLLVDEFYLQYLKNDPELSRFLAHTDGSVLLRKLKEFIVFLFSEPLDQRYVDRIEQIGFVHYSIRLTPAKVSYAFWALRELLIRMAEVNTTIRSSRDMISRILGVAEYVMNHSYEAYVRSEQKTDRSHMQIMGTFDALYGSVHLHRQNFAKVEAAYRGETPMEELSSLVHLDPHFCMMGKLLEGLASDATLLVQIGIDLKQIEALHAQWHEHLKAFLAAPLQSLSQREVLQRLGVITDEIARRIDTPMHSYGNESLLVLSSGMKAMRSMMERFYYLQSQEYETLFAALKEEFAGYFSWGLSQVMIGFEPQSASQFDLYRAIALGEQTIHVGIRFNPLSIHSYLRQMIELLLEVLEVNFHIQERERSLMAFAQVAESANRSKDIFLANMSHELRTPLNAITGFSQILMMRPDTPDNVKKYVEKINIAGNSLLELVNTILDFAKLESGKMQFNPQLSSLKSMIDQVYALVSAQAQKKQIALSIPSIQSLNLLLDAHLMRQVLVNLLSNAIKFTPEGGSVSLALSYDERDKAYIFSVCDNGIGIAKEEQEKLFKPFSQVENVYHKEQKGTGLGLMICKKIVEELHKGRIWVESDSGKGSCFYVKLPIPSLESHTYMVEESESTRQLLVVEDSVPHQQMIIEHLKPLYRITVTDTVNRAKELLVSNRYDFIILDFFLIDGVSSEVLQFMDEERIDTPCIVISAEHDISIAQALSGYTNLQSILNKEDIHEICSMLKNPEP
ncbi:MAG: hypothetical protein JXK05_05815 [Campylobacterales bacterium]|nr:hypothetical protein [Campylobacterales bacterium]